MQPVTFHRATCRACALALSPPGAHFETSESHLAHAGAQLVQRAELGVNPRLLPKRVAVEAERAGGEPRPRDATGRQHGAKPVGLERLTVVDAELRIHLGHQPGPDVAPLFN